MDIASILVIVWFIGLTYYKRYKDTGYLYVKTQLELISAYCISLVVNLYAYYWAEERFNIDEKYTKGIILTFVFVVAGYIVIIPGLSEPPVRTLRAIYSGNSEPPYWALLHIFPLYCKDTPLV